MEEKAIKKLAEEMDSKWRCGTGKYCTDYEWWLSAIRYLHEQKEMIPLKDILQVLQYELDTAKGSDINYKYGLETGIATAMRVIQNLIKINNTPPNSTTIMGVSGPNSGAGFD